MSKFMLGRKLGMTQIFNEDGTVVPVTVIQAGPLCVLDKRTPDKHTYEALVVAFEEVEQKRVNKPVSGYYKAQGQDVHRVIREFRVSTEGFEVGQVVQASDAFAEGDYLDATAITAGKGFQGSIKRHGQSRGPETHGSTYHRRPGSLGACSTPSRVMPGKKLPGQMGRVQRTVQNLQVVSVDQALGVILIKGAVPGKKGGLVTMSGAVKKSV